MNKDENKENKKCMFECIDAFVSQFMNASKVRNVVVCLWNCVLCFSLPLLGDGLHGTIGSYDKIHLTSILNRELNY